MNEFEKCQLSIRAFITLLFLIKIDIILLPYFPSYSVEM